MLVNMDQTIRAVRVPYSEYVMVECCMLDGYHAPCDQRVDTNPERQGRVNTWSQPFHISWAQPLRSVWSVVVAVNHDGRDRTALTTLKEGCGSVYE